MAAEQSGNATLELLGGWRLTVDGRVLFIPGREQRVIAAVALLGPRPRRQLAELLWPDGNGANARSNLRVNLWDIGQRCPGVFTGSDQLAIASNVALDVSSLRKFPGSFDDCTSTSYLWELLEFTRRAELLPGWLESWLDFEQEQVRLLRLRALEALGKRFLALGDADGALMAAVIAVSEEPWRETAYELLMKAHVLAGNRALALRVFENVRLLLLRELDVEPAPMLVSLAAELRRSSQADVSCPSHERRLRSE